MANLTGNYDPNAEAQQEFSAIPTGEYTAVIVESDVKDTKKGDGKYIELVHEITEGQYKGRKVWARLNTVNPNPQTSEIGNRQWASVREATGVMSPQDTQEVHYKPMVIRIEFIRGGVAQKNGYVPDRDGNEIKAWKKASAAAPQMSTQPLTTSAPAAGDNTPPWQRQAA